MRRAPSVKPERRSPRHGPGIARLWAGTFHIARHNQPAPHALARRASAKERIGCQTWPTLEKLGIHSPAKLLE